MQKGKDHRGELSSKTPSNPRWLQPGHPPLHQSPWVCLSKKHRLPLPLGNLRPEGPLLLLRFKWVSVISWANPLKSRAICIVANSLALFFTISSPTSSSFIYMIWVHNLVQQNFLYIMTFFILVWKAFGLHHISKERFSAHIILYYLLILQPFCKPLAFQGPAHHKHQLCLPSSRRVQRKPPRDLPAVCKIRLLLPSGKHWCSDLWLPASAGLLWTITKNYSWNCVEKPSASRLPCHNLSSACWRKLVVWVWRIHGAYANLQPSGSPDLDCFCRFHITARYLTGGIKSYKSTIYCYL